MAPRQGPRRPRQSHAGAPASPSARVDPGREHLAVLARQLVVEPRVRLLRRHRRPLLLRVEPPHRPALDHHVHRPPRLGQCIQCMMISAGWYSSARGSAGLSRQPTTKQEAVAKAKALSLAGHNLDLGLMGLPAASFAAYGITIEQAFDACTSLRVASTRLKMLTKAAEMRGLPR